MEPADVPLPPAHDSSQQNQGDICIAGSTLDPISSVRSVQELTALYDNPTVKTNNTLGHDSTKALEDCAKELTP